MSKKNAFNFTHLEEDDDADDIVADIGQSHLDVDLQPHLSISSLNNYHVDSDVESGHENGHQGSPEDTKTPEVEVVGEKKGAASKSVNTHNNNNNKRIAEGMNQGGNAQSGQTSSQQNGAQTPSGQLTIQAASKSTVKVQYDSSEGKVNVMQGQVVTRPDGTRYIDTQGIPDRWSELEKPLRKRRIRMLKIFSIAACVFFFPSGIPAAYFAFRTEKEFDEGIMRGNIDRAQKFAKRSERLIILSFVMSIVVAALVVALVERPYFRHEAHRGTLVG